MSDFDIAGAVLRAERASMRALLSLAHQAEAYAKERIEANNQVDTGFMLNSIYVSTTKRSGYAAAYVAAVAKVESRKTGATVNHEGDMGEEVSPDEFGADVSLVVGANYAIFQETAKPFLRPAVTQARADVERSFGVAFKLEGF